MTHKKSLLLLLMMSHVDDDDEILFIFSEVVGENQRDATLPLVCSLRRALLFEPPTLLCSCLTGEKKVQVRRLT